MDSEQFIEDVYIELHELEEEGCVMSVELSTYDIIAYMNDGTPYWMVALLMVGE
jgi:hypothetical protein